MGSDTADLSRQGEAVRLSPKEAERLGIRSKGHHKYHAIRTAVDNVSFSSKAEALRYSWLKLRLRLGEISDLRIQPEYELHAINLDTGEMPVIGVLRLDFDYLEKGSDVRICEDVKGMGTLPLAKWKQRHLRMEYGLVVSEIRKQRTR
jgi:hypothetical protein